MTVKSVVARLCGVALFCVVPLNLWAGAGVFDIDRWYAIIEDIKGKAASQNVSQDTINATFRSPAFIPSIVKSDRNQAEFKLTLDGYLARTVNQRRITEGKQMRQTYPTMLSRVEQKYGVQPHVILAFWGLESNYGANKARHKLTDAFLTLMYEGRRQEFFEKQLLALMKIADDNDLDINDIQGSWAGAMGHFQFIPTTLMQYGADGNGDGKIDIIHSVGDAMFSAGNYLNRLGWNENEKIVRKVVIPINFDTSLLDGKTKKNLSDWANMGVTNPDGSPLPVMDMTAGLVADINMINDAKATAIAHSKSNVIDPNAIDTDVAPQPVVVAYLTYPNFYRIKRWNNSNWYAIAIATLADELK